MPVTISSLIPMEGVLPQVLFTTFLATAVGAAILYTVNYPMFAFIYNTMIKPFITKSKAGEKYTDAHQGRLETFYEGQMDIYDTTRKRLLRGRATMLRLCAGQLMKVYPDEFTAHGEVTKLEKKLEKEMERTDSIASLGSLNATESLSSLFQRSNKRRLAWVDIGGGTGSNIEKMNESFPISNFEKVYLVDITPSMCETARKRFVQLGWTNVTVVCCGAEEFKIPPQDIQAEGKEDLEVALVTFSYSLSMMENIYPVVDRVTKLLSPSGIIGVADFYVSGKHSTHDPTRQLSWFKRWFWSMWFDMDGIYLHPSRREYLEHRFSTVKMVSHLNPFIQNLIYIPYYVWVGSQKYENTLGGASPHASEDIDFLNLDGNDSDAGEKAENPIFSPYSYRAAAFNNSSSAALPNSLFASKDSVHGAGFRWRESYDVTLNTMFDTYIYAFAWEDPREDLKALKLNKDDVMFVMTSGGENVLEYAFEGVKRIHAVDMNPCQGHMLELKLAAITQLGYDDFWRLFGEGFLPNFHTALETKLASAMSPYAYQFWLRNRDFKNLYLTGCSGIAIKVFRAVQKICRMKNAITRMCHATTIEEQVKIWYMEVRPKLLHPLFIKCLNNDRFLWGALGVPENQAAMIYNEGTLYDYVANTLDPIIHKTLLLNDNYFYYMPMMLTYSKQCRPTYLTEEAHERYNKPGGLDMIKIHTDKMINVLANKVKDDELTKAVVMDHLDWFSEQDARDEIALFYRKIKSGGECYWRSAGKYPWYNKLFEEAGFRVEAIEIRENHKCIDRVNMYASFWVGYKN